MSGIDKFQFMQLQEKYNELSKAHVKLKEENEKLINALEFYASNEAWNLKEYFDLKEDDDWELTGGKLARQTLKEIKGDRQ